jgi:hypothetical protein
MQQFDCNETSIVYYPEKYIIVCIAYGDGKKVWAKKMHEPVAIQNVLFDERYYYIACKTGDTEGIFLTLDKSNGSTVWFIPGCTSLEVLYRGYLYLIFVDENEQHFLIKVECDEGNKLWFHQIDSDLYYYHFKEDCIILHYASGKKEMLQYDGKVLLR